MRRLLSSSHCDATDQAGPEIRRSRGRRRGFAARRSLAVLVGCVALLAVAPVASAVASTGISGTVTEAEAPHAGVKSANVCLYSESFTLIECRTGVTNASGEYTIEGLTEGHYRVGFSATGFATQYWDDVSSLSESTSVEVTTGHVSEHINAALEEAGEGSVAGRVTSASNGAGAGGVEVCIYTKSNHCAETNGNGEYTISGLSAGSYTIYFYPASTCEEEQGEKTRCQPKSNYVATSVSVKVKANKTEIVNVALQVGGQLSGTVTNASITHPGIGKIRVCATKVLGTAHEYEEYGSGGCAYTNSSGQYTISGLESGAYKVEFNGYICSIPKKGEEECPEVYVTQYYHGKQTHKQAETIAVATGSNTGGINESLHEAFPTTPVSTGAPVLTGTPAAGKALSCSQGSWSHEPTFLAYQWLRNGTVISGQTGATYTLQAADQGKSVTCVVWAGNGAGAASATSKAVSIPVPLAVFARVKVKGTVASVTLRCPGPGVCSGVMKLVVRMRHGKRVSKVVIGQVRFSIAAGKSKTLRVHLNGQGRKLFGKAGRGGLKVQIAGSGVKVRAATLKVTKAGKHK